MHNVLDRRRAVRGPRPTAHELGSDTAGRNGYDAGNKVSGIKRHITVDNQGLPHAVVVTTADITDRKGALQTMDQYKASGCAQSVLADSGYVGQAFAEAMEASIAATMQIANP